MFFRFLCLFLEFIWAQIVVVLRYFCSIVLGDLFLFSACYSVDLHGNYIVVDVEQLNRLLSTSGLLYLRWVVNWFY